MNELDGRKKNRKALEEIRIRAVKRVEAGESPEVVTKALGLTHPRIYEWIAKKVAIHYISDQPMPLIQCIGNCLTQ